jgi:hypothetical protein
MGEYRVRETAEVLTQGQLRKLNPNVSLPKVWGANVMESLGIDPVLASPRPEPSGEYKTVVRNGVEQDANGNWVYAWTERDMFSDYTDEDGTVHTKAKQEEAYTARMNEEAAKSVRTKRDSLLAETDWLTLRAADTGAAMSEEWAAYRQSLRDITDHANFPNLTEEDWPTKPE